MKDTNTERFTEELAVELGQIVNKKMAGAVLNAADRRRWNNINEWKHISKLIGDDMTATAFEQLNH